jgi:hypothetical protein
MRSPFLSVRVEQKLNPDNPKIFLTDIRDKKGMIRDE